MIEIELDDMKNANMRSIEEALNLRLSSIESLVLLILIIAGNSSARSEREKDEILDGAVKKYTKKKEE